MGGIASNVINENIATLMKKLEMSNDNVSPLLPISRLPPSDFLCLAKLL